MEIHLCLSGLLRFTRDRFLVDEGSDLYYDPTILLESAKNQKERDTADDRASMPPQPPDFAAQHTPQPHRVQPNGYPYGGNVTPAMNYPSTRHGNHMGNVYPGGPFNPIPPNQFYGTGDGLSPMRMGTHLEANNITPDIRRRVTRGMADDGYGMHGI
jgi:hypothetical protein